MGADPWLSRAIYSTLEASGWSERIFYDASIDVITKSKEEAYALNNVVYQVHRHD
jgi:hypothetical protein